MRLALVLALVPVLAGGVAMVVGACGGSEFTAGATDGGAVDAPAGPTGPSGSFCELEAGTHTFCDDFDDEYDGSTLTGLWPTYDRTTGATAQDDTSVFVSSPNSFEAACPSSAGVTGGPTLLHARVGKQFSVASHVVIAFDIHLDMVGVKPNGVGGTTFILLTLGANYSLGLTANKDSVNGYEDITEPDGGTTDTNETVLATSSILGNWTHIVFDADLAHAKIAATVGTTPFGPITITPPTGLAPTVYVGLSSRNVTLPVEAHYDNVTVDVTP